MLRVHLSISTKSGGPVCSDEKELLIRVTDVCAEGLPARGRLIVLDRVTVTVSKSVVILSTFVINIEHDLVLTGATGYVHDINGASNSIHTEVYLSLAFQQCAYRMKS